ncbi:hypothetical protein QSA_1598 [Clostridioides difficile P21]|nr:hypothetical protein QMC_1486 [Clostridioides difficile DA00245]EQH71598.1 hypothetical protein QMQ_1531 [Clostridioides difficile DA00306]EQH84364.1 hypothetical protein QMW_1504 [Clostridioides difficile DA00313]EQI47018.1 hypothetical protein QQ1_1448 [Clostridioides difficile Y247]EQI82677.1 hypothetical protein QQI_1419 [Clostridioides difficile Y401]EQJ36967.1 hypothetical protein QSA_1598 [Clostridioides difficile P21]EQK08044.1 hypothetical protein QUM_1493 [Clostridioides difficil
MECKYYQNFFFLLNTKSFILTIWNVNVIRGLNTIRVKEGFYINYMECKWW